MAQGNHTDKIFRESETMLRKVIEHPAFGTTEKEKEVTISYLGRARGRAHRAPIKIVKGQQSDQGIILIVQPAGNNTCCKVLFSVSGEQPEKVRQRLERVLPYLERKGGKWHLRSPDEKEEEEMTDKVTEEVLSAESQTQPPESPAKPRRWGRGDKREMAIEVIKEFVQTRAEEQGVTVEQVEFRSSEIIPKVEELCESTQDGSRALFENACKTLIREGKLRKIKKGVYRATSTLVSAKEPSAPDSEPKQTKTTPEAKEARPLSMPEPCQPSSPPPSASPIPKKYNKEIGTILVAAGDLITAIGYLLIALDKDN